MFKKFIVVLVIVIVSISNIVSAAQITFDDVENHWAKNEIYTMAEKWVILGKGNGNFGPDEKIIKTHAFLMFSRLMGYYDKENKEVIADAEKEFGQYLEKNGITQSISEIAFLIKTEVISVEDVIKILGDNQEKENLTREEAAYIFVKLLNDEEKLPQFISEIFKDTKMIDEKYIKYVEYVKNIDLMKGMDESNFGPKENVTRAQIATILYRIDNIIYERALTEINGEIKKINNYSIIIETENIEKKYSLTKDTLIYQEGKLLQISDLKENDLIQIFVKSNQDIDRIYLNNTIKNIYGAFAGYEVNSETGELEKIHINQNDKQYTYLVSNKISIQNGINKVDIDNILIDENIQITLLNNKITQIDIGKIYYKEKGMIEQLIIGKQNYINIINLKGESKEYKLIDDCIYDFDGANGNIYDLRLNMDVELSVTNEGVDKIIVQTLTNIEIITGTVEKILPKIYVFTIKTLDEQVQMMFLDEDETVIKTKNGLAKDITDISSGDLVSIYGRFEGEVFYPIQVIIHDKEEK